MLKVGLLGTWHVHFKNYAGDIHKREDCVITSLWDPDEETAKKNAEAFSCAYTTDIDEFFKGDFEAVICCATTNIHPEVLIKAAKAGKHIFTEKVLTAAPEDAYAVRQAVIESGMEFCISFPFRARADFLWVKKALDEGLIGEVSYCRMRNAHNGVSGGWLPDSFLDPVPTCGGAMLDLGAHSMYILNWLMGKPLKAASSFTNVLCKTVEDNAVTMLQYANGAVGVSETGFVTGNNPFSFEAAGTKGTIMLGGVADRLCYNINGKWEYPEIGENLANPIDCFVNGILYGEDIPYTIDDAVMLTETMAAAYGNII